MGDPKIKFGGLGRSRADLTYLRLDCSNDPLTGLGLDFNNDDFTFKNLVQDKDIIFNVNKGGVDTEVLRFDSDAGRNISSAPFLNVGNLQGPTWKNIYYSIEMGAAAVMMGQTTARFRIGQNFYRTTADQWKRQMIGYSNQLDMINGDFTFLSADTGAAEGIVTFVEVAKITKEGQLQLDIQGVGAGLLLGEDTHLYRSAANELTIPDKLVISAAAGVLISGSLGGVGLHLDSSSGAGILLDRGATTNASGVKWQTANVDKWFMGMYNEATENLHIKLGNWDGTDHAILNTSGQWQLPIQGSSAGLLMGGDVHMYREGANQMRLQNVHVRWTDGYKAFFGTGADASIRYNAVDLIINPKEVGSGNVLIGTANNSAVLNLGGANECLSLDAALSPSIKWDSSHASTAGTFSWQLVGATNKFRMFRSLNSLDLLTFHEDDLHVRFPNDSQKTMWGAGGGAGTAAGDCSVYYDNTNMRINPKEIGTGYLQVDGEILATDKILFTQVDGNEYIDSLADGYLDLAATTEVRIVGPALRVQGDLYVGNNAAVDPVIVFDGDTNDGQITYYEDENNFLFSTNVRVVAAWHAFGGFEDQAETIACGAGDWNHITNAGSNLWNCDEEDGISCTSDIFTIANTGDYSGTLSVSLSGLTGKDFHIRVYNNTQTRVEGRPIGVSTTGANNEMNVSVPIYIEATAADAIQFEIMSADGSDPTVDDALFVITYLHD